MKVKDLNNEDYIKFQSMINSELNTFINYIMFLLFLAIINVFAYYIGNQIKTTFIINNVIIILLALASNIIYIYCLNILRKRFNITSDFTLFKKKNQIPPNVLNDYEEFKKFQEFKNKNLEIKEEIDVLKKHDYSNLPVIEVSQDKKIMEKQIKEDKKKYGF